MYRHRSHSAQFKLAYEIVTEAGAVTPYHQARVIESYLRDNIKYNELIPRPPAGQDPVDWVLFDHQEGYCNYYASAMIVMLRSLGIPARMAAGFAQGTYDNEEGMYVVTEHDAHTWVEAYFPGYGWIEFEPTTAQEPIDRGDNELDGSAIVPPNASPTNTPTPTITPTPTNTPAPTITPTPTNTPTDIPEGVVPPPTLTPTVTFTFTPTPTLTPVIVPTTIPPPPPPPPPSGILQALKLVLLGLLFILLMFALALFLWWWWEWRGMRGFQSGHTSLCPAGAIYRSTWHSTWAR